MKKDEPSGGLLSKVVRFVRRPTPDGSELDPPRLDAAVAQGHAVLQVVLESKRRNDLAREREFNLLRELVRQRQTQHASAEVPGRESRLQPTDTFVPGIQPGATIEKIARIEAQMSRHWPNRHRGVAVPALFAFPALREAAVSFANGDDAAVEHGLRAVLAREAGNSVGRLAWESLLDCFVSTAQVAAFESLAGEFAVRYGVARPAWPLLPATGAAAPPLGCPPQRATELDLLEWPAMPSDTLPMSALPAELAEPAPAALPQLRGVLRGDIAPVLWRLQAALERHPRGQLFAIDCRALARVDPVAAGSLLQWMPGALVQGARPELVGVNRLVAVFFHLLGLDAVAPVRLREY